MSAKIRILVVDDELIVRESLKGWLKKGGYEVDTAASGPESLEMLELAPYDLLFLLLKNSCSRKELSMKTCS